VARVDADACTGCGTCEELCQFHAIHVTDGVALVNVEECMGCGVCEANCPSQAIELALEPSKGVPLHIQELMELEQVATL
jgi:heterodisulfide reductase subunit A-like polyferredoxin